MNKSISFDNVDVEMLWDQYQALIEILWDDPENILWGLADMIGDLPFDQWGIDIPAE